MDKPTKKSFRTDKDRPRVYVPTSDRETLPSRVKQEPRDEVNINSIIKRMRKQHGHAYADVSQFRDVSNAPKSLQDAFNVTQEAARLFQTLPLGFRRELDHNPAALETAPRELYERYGLLKQKEGAPPKEQPAPAPKGNQAVKKGSKDPVQPSDQEE